MSFLLIVIVSLAVLGIVAALLSRGPEEAVHQPEGNCSECSSRSECKLAELADKSRRVCSLLLVLLVLTGCSTKKNTSQVRLWHSFTARYNTYYNGSQAFIDGALEQEKGNHDNYTEFIPLYTVGNKATRALGSGNFDRAIEKAGKTIKQHSIKSRPEWNKSRRKTQRDIEWLSRREYNPFLWRAWLLLGKAQFQKGEFEEAAATFSYMSRLYQSQPAVRGIARAWQAKSYVELGWLYDAEDLIVKQQRDSMHYRARKDWDYALADYYLRSGRYSEAAASLRKVVGHERRRKQKARELFLLGQLYAAQGRNAEAYVAFRRVIRLSPPYELEFNARIAQTEVMAQGNAKAMISRLKRMAASDNNKDYLDQVYYAIGNIYMAQKDTLKAVEAYEQGRKKATRSGIEKGVLLLTLGNVYWQRERFPEAQKCYAEAIGLLDKDRPDYRQLAERSKVLDELAPHIESVELQDSLLRLAAMPEDQLNKVIDHIIAELKKKEKEERDAQLAAEAERVTAQNAANTGARMPPQRQLPQTTGGSQQWYFYNQQAVSQGKQTFQQLWGRRENVDNWQRMNRTVVSLTPADGEEAADSATVTAADSTATAALENAKAAADSVAADTAALDPHKREYYLAQIPFTDEQKADCHSVLQEELFQAGIIIKDKLDNLRLGERMLTRLATDYPEFSQMDVALYHLFLIHSRNNNKLMADSVLARMADGYPESPWTVLLSDPLFEENQRFGVHIEDSLYASVYDAFRESRYADVYATSAMAAQRFPQGLHRPKFLLVEGLSLLNDGRQADCIDRLKQVVENYQDSEVSDMAGMILRGVQQGRKLQGGVFDMADMWNRRSLEFAADSAVTDTLSFERNASYVFLLAFHPDSVNHNKLLFELARHNFSNYLVRNFDIQTDQDAVGMARMIVSGFNSYDEARQYARQLYAVGGQMGELLVGCRSLIVSEKNLPLVGTAYSYHDYEVFFDHAVEPVVVPDDDLLDIIPVDDNEQPADSETGSSNVQQQPAVSVDDDGLGLPPPPVQQQQPAVPADDDGLGLPPPSVQQQQPAAPVEDEIGEPVPQQQQAGAEDYDDFDEDFWR